MEWWKLWNDGFKENETQSTYSAFIFTFYGVFYRAKTGKISLMSIIKECRFNIFCRIDLFPLFLPSLPWPGPNL
jgi:hypothetical protein